MGGVLPPGLATMPGPEAPKGLSKYQVTRGTTKAVDILRKENWRKAVAAQRVLAGMPGG